MAIAGGNQIGSRLFPQPGPDPGGRVRGATGHKQAPILKRDAPMVGGGDLDHLAPQWKLGAGHRFDLFGKGIKARAEPADMGLQKAADLALTSSDRRGDAGLAGTRCNPQCQPPGPGRTAQTHRDRRIADLKQVRISRQVSGDERR